VNITFPIDGHELLATMVAYLVVSRVSASYTRFWEARSLLSIALQAARQLSVQAAAFTNKDQSDGANLWRTMIKHRMTHLMYVMVQVIKAEDKTYQYVGTNQDLDKTMTTSGTEVSGAEAEYDLSESIPAISYALHKDIVRHKDFLQEPLFIHKELKLHQLLMDFENTIYEMSKFAATPYPFPTTQMTRIFLFVWMFSLPFSLVYGAKEPYTTPILMFFITYGFFGLEFVSIELDDPFGEDDNDLAIDDLSKVIVKGINDDLQSKAYVEKSLS